MTTTHTDTTRRLGADGPLVGAVGLGCMGMSWAYGTNDDEARSIATVHRAMERAGAAADGARVLLDTADVYGPFVNEELVGRALRGRRDEAVLATKVGLVSDPPTPGEAMSLPRRSAHPDRIGPACEDSLRRLGVEVLDLYQLHRVDPEVPLEDTWAAMAALVDRGLVRRIGLSAVTVDEAERAHAIHPVASIQSELSLWRRTPVEDGTLAWAAEHGAAFLPFSPLGRGVLTGTVDPTALGADDFRSLLPQFRGEAWRENRSTIDVVREIAGRHDATAAQVALAWVLSRGAHVLPIPGTTRPARYDENLGAAALALGDDEVAALDATATAVGEDLSA